MKKKFLDTTYLKHVSDYDIKYIESDSFYGAVKTINNVYQPFVSYTGFNLIDKGYYIVEILPKNEHYGMRVFLDNQKNILEYYFDIIKETGIEKGIPYYLDLYTDVMIINDEIKVLDEDELKEALDTHDITKDDYNLAYETKNKLLKELKENKNVYKNMNIKKII